MSANALSSLTAREREIVVLAANGLSNKEIARRLGLTEGTVFIFTAFIVGSASEIVPLLLGWFTRPDPVSSLRGMSFKTVRERLQRITAAIGKGEGTGGVQTAVGTAARPG